MCSLYLIPPFISSTGRNSPLGTETTIGERELTRIKYKPTTNQPRRWAVFILWIICCVTACGEDPSPPSPHVGSQDCDVLDNTPGVSQGLCTECQGQACPEVLTCDPESDPECGTCSLLFPCVDGQLVVQGCVSDSDCSEFEGFYCGLGTSSNKYLCGSDMGDF